MKLEISQESFNIVKLLLTQTYVELNNQIGKREGLPFHNRLTSDTANRIKTALKEIGIEVMPTKIELDKEGNFK